jgi:uncharacterized membrane protein YhhN
MSVFQKVVLIGAGSFLIAQLLLTAGAARRGWGRWAWVPLILADGIGFMAWIWAYLGTRSDLETAVKFMAAVNVLACLVLVGMITSPPKAKAADAARTGFSGATTASDVVCAACNTPNPSTSRFCGACGASLQPTVCSQCGEPNPPGSEFCGECGASLLAGEQEA